MMRIVKALESQYRLALGILLFATDNPTTRSVSSRESDVAKQRRKPS